MRFKNYIEKIVDNRGKNPEKYFSSGKYPVLDNYLIKNELYPNLKKVERYIDENTFRTFLRDYTYEGMVVMTLVGNGIGNVTTIPNDNVVIIQNTIGFKPVKEILIDKFLYYFFLYNQEKIRNFDRGSGQPSIKQRDILEMEVSFPSLETQQKIAKVLSAFDDKIELNNKINENLEQQTQALYKNKFIDNKNNNRTYCKAEDFFDISIGKTPPRKEFECFSNNNGVIWVSISDMGKCGMYIDNSSEYLTKDAIKKYNVKIVPNNTVILSFKLTVGRIAITNGEMATNEAIAHFNTDNKNINEYLYCYLKRFNFQTMGSTSSIATAINSKIIKAIPFIIPEKDELINFHNLVSPMFKKIKENLLENKYLIQLRDTLLPKLMNGEIDVDKINI